MPQPRKAIVIQVDSIRLFLPLQCFDMLVQCVSPHYLCNQFNAKFILFTGQGGSENLITNNSSVVCITPAELAGVAEGREIDRGILMKTMNVVPTVFPKNRCILFFSQSKTVTSLRTSL